MVLLQDSSVEGVEPSQLEDAYVGTPTSLVVVSQAS